MAWCLTMSQARAVGRSAPWGAGREVFGRRSVGARLCRDATLGARRWQPAREMRFPASDSGKISARCVPVLPALARCRRGAFPGVDPWQFFASCVPEGASDGKTPVRGNISPACIQIHLILARYACYASEKPRKAPLGNAPREHLAAKGRFRRPKPSNRARRTNLATLRWPCPCAGAPARAAASRDRLPAAWPLPRGACSPAPRRYPPPADTRRLPCPLQPGSSRRWASAAIVRRMACSPAKPRGTADCVISTGRPTTECCAELGLDSRTVNKWAQNRRRRPQARPGLRQRCRKRPSKGRVPLGGTIGAPPK